MHGVGVYAVSTDAITFTNNAKLLYVTAVVPTTLQHKSQQRSSGGVCCSTSVHCSLRSQSPRTLRATRD